MRSWPCQADYSVYHPITATSQMQVTSPLYPLFASLIGVSLAPTKTKTKTKPRLDSDCRSLFHLI